MGKKCIIKHKYLKLIQNEVFVEHFFLLKRNFFQEFYLLYKIEFLIFIFIPSILCHLYLKQSVEAKNK
jgi:hypothetical protein